jgi:cytoskeletal protein CcmA (bactofilin family)
MSLFGKGSAGELNGFLDKGSHLEGELRFEQTFRVDGRVTGRVVSTGDLVVGERGEIEGEVEVGRLYVSGTVRGKVRARRLEIAARGRLFAEVETPALVVEEGALFEGACAMEREARPEIAPAEPARVARLQAVKDR